MGNQVKNDILSYGKKEAPVKVEVFLNLACPYCATYFAMAEEVLGDYINNGQVEYIVKHYDKPREMLLPGALINLSLDYENPNRVREIMKELFEKQSQWDVLSNHEIKNMIEEEFGLKEEPVNTEISLKVIAEAIQRNVKMVPTVFINDKEYQYPREISADELRNEIEAVLVK